MQLIVDLVFRKFFFQATHPVYAEKEKDKDVIGICEKKLPRFKIKF